MSMTTSTAEPLTDERLEEIRAENESKRPGPCLQCGGTLEVAVVGGGRVKWSCPNVRTPPRIGRHFDADHYRASIVESLLPSRAVADLLGEVDRLRTLVADLTGRAG